MRKMTIAELVELLKNIKATKFIGIVTETSGKNSFNLSKNGDRKDKMSAPENLNCRPENIVKYSHKSVLITPLSFKELVENRNEKGIKEILEKLNLSTDDLEKQLSYADWAKAQSAKEYDVGARKNGTSLSGALVESAKDEAPMITVYNNARNRPRTDFYLNDELMNKDDLKPYRKPYDFDKKYKKQLEHGVVNPIDTQNYRLENIRQVNMDGEQYEVVPA